MADDDWRKKNPFDFENPFAIPAPPRNKLEDLVSLLSGSPPPPKPNPFAGLLSGLAPPPAPPRTRLGSTGLPVDGLFGTLAPENSLANLGLLQPIPRSVLPVAPLPTAPPRALPVLPLSVKRKAFFSFHFEDVFRVNVVRNAWKIGHPDSPQMRSFYDSSLWESRKLEGPDSLKRLIRGGVRYTSAVCVLIGTATWSRPWVRYEIARAIIDGRGLLGVHINSIRHRQTGTQDFPGLNPLDFMAVGKVKGADGVARYYLFEKLYASDGVGGVKPEWHRYKDHTDPVQRPRWLTDPAIGYVTPLSDNGSLFDYMADGGHRNIGAWIDAAAKSVGR